MFLGVSYELTMVYKQELAFNKIFLCKYTRTYKWQKHDTIKLNAQKSTGNNLLLVKDKSRCNPSLAHSSM